VGGEAVAIISAEVRVAPGKPQQKGKGMRGDSGAS